MSPDRLSTTFSALADPTRRAILARLASGEASVTELAEPFAMSLPAISKHLKVLERAGLISRSRKRNGGPVSSKPVPSRARRIGCSTTVTSGKRASIGWRHICASFRERARNVAASTDTVAQTAERELVVTRIIDAPRRLVFKAWTEPDQVAAARAGLRREIDSQAGWIGRRPIVGMAPPVIAIRWSTDE